MKSDKLSLLRTFRPSNSECESCYFSFLNRYSNLLKNSVINKQLINKIFELRKKNNNISLTRALITYQKLLFVSMTI